MSRKCSYKYIIDVCLLNLGCTWSLPHDDSIPKTWCSPNPWVPPHHGLVFFDHLNATLWFFRSSCCISFPTAWHRRRTICLLFSMFIYDMEIFQWWVQKRSSVLICVIILQYKAWSCVIWTKGQNISCWLLGTNPILPSWFARCSRYSSNFLQRISQHASALSKGSSSMRVLPFTA